MRYLSTRGGVAPLTFSQAVMMGLASDGGLLLPETIPTVDAETLAAWAGLPFAELAIEVIGRFVGDDIPRDDLAELIRRSYATFTHPEVTPLVAVDGFQVLELFHGPTLAFKDVALQFLGNLFEYLLKRDGGKLNIIGATSGDTGSAAIYGVRGKANIDIFILHPHNRVSPVQERQMTSVLDGNVHNIAIEGSFDDAQGIVKQLFGDADFKRDYQLGAVNSINWARIAAQIVYYFHAWGRLSGGDVNHKPVFSVPTGNFGDIFAGYVAKRMGLPVERMVIATNRNDILARFVASGAYASGECYATLSPAMDIQVSSNFERYLYYLMDGDATAVKGLMEGFAATGRLEVSEEKLAQVHTDFAAHAVDEEQTLATIREVFEATGYVLDPHTAVGVAAARAEGVDGAVCLATAHPAKFTEAVQRAIGREEPLPASFADLMERESRMEILPADAGAIREYMQRTLS
ncbi:threonine synthase [Endothiovibrio diazotrophicus]